MIHKQCKILVFGQTTYRYDDPNIRIDDEGTMIPGNDYQIRSSFNDKTLNSSPITLYYIPEAHYEVLKLKSHNELQIQKLIEKFSVLMGTNPDSHDIAETLLNISFKLLKEITDLEEFYIMLLSVISFEEEAKDIKQKREDLENLILNFKSLIYLLPNHFIESLERKGEKVLVVLLKIFISNTLKSLEHSIEGPQSIFYELLKYLDSLFHSNEESLVSKESNNLSNPITTLKCNPISSPEILDLNKTISSQE